MRPLLETESMETGTDALTSMALISKPLSSRAALLRFTSNLNNHTFNY
jgi:hypothetical protein